MELPKTLLNRHRSRKNKFSRCLASIMENNPVIKTRIEDQDLIIDLIIDLNRKHNLNVYVEPVTTMVGTIRNPEIIETGEYCLSLSPILREHYKVGYFKTKRHQGRSRKQINN